MTIFFISIAVVLLVAFIRCLDRNAKWESECQRLQAACLKKRTHE